MVCSFRVGWWVWGRGRASGAGRARRSGVARGRRGGRERGDVHDRAARRSARRVEPQATPSRRDVRANRVDRVIGLVVGHRGASFRGETQCRRSAGGCKRVSRSRPYDRSAMPEPIPIELLLAGRDLTEPRLSPDGRRSRSCSAGGSVGDRGRPGRSAARSALGHRGPDPAPGRGMGGGCFDWLPTARRRLRASDGELWLQRVGTRSPAHVVGPSVPRARVSRRRRVVVCVVDEAEVWSRRSTDGPPPPRRRCRRFCFDPAVGPDSRRSSWQAWSPPSMPWDDARVVTRAHDELVDRVAAGRTRLSSSRRFMPDGRRVRARRRRDGSTSDVGGRPIVAEPFEHAGPTWGMGQRSFAASPDGVARRVQPQRARFGRLCIVDSRPAT